MRPTAALLLACAAAALRPGATAADQGTENRLREALRSTTAQLRALEDERAGRAAAEAALQKELEAARAEAAAARRAGAARPSRAEGDLKQRLAEQSEAAAKATSALSACEAKVRAGAETALGAEGERNRLAAEVTSLGERLAQSRARNERLYQVGKELIDWLSRMGFGDALAAREPVLGLKRVQLENAAQDFEDRLLEQKERP